MVLALAFRTTPLPQSRILGRIYSACRRSGPSKSRRSCRGTSTAGITDSEMATRGTAVLYKKEPLSVSFGLGDDDADEEGRTIILEYKGFYLINAYVPNSQKNLIRHAYRLE